MDISNRALAVLLLAAMVVSLGGTIISLNKLGTVTTTGYATSDLGNVTLTVANSLSITLDSNDLINFGSCQPAGGGANYTINSEDGANTPTACSAFTADNFSIRNDGNVAARVSALPNKVGDAQGGTFLVSTSGGSAIAIKTIQGAPGRGNGCVGTMLANYVNLSSTTANVTACTNLTYPGQVGASNDSFSAQIQIVLPFDVPIGQNDVIFTFTAWNA